MSIIKWEPLSDINKYFDERLFRPIPALWDANLWNFDVDLYEKDNNLIAKTTIPGIDPKDIDVSIENRNLTIAGKRNEEKEERGTEYYSKEIRKGAFSHSITLPKFVDSDNIKAEYIDGVLSINMPIIKGQEKKTIKIKTKDGSN